ncbi:MAG TPA: hypothetical protein VKC60_03730 [Opitutaceae bacterium]|nr:hypothetical protein [Opitutaceae bacterium]
MNQTSGEGQALFPATGELSRELMAAVGKAGVRGFVLPLKPDRAYHRFEQ